MNEFYNKLVDMYAGRELPVELEDEMVAAAANNPDLALDMRTLRETVDAARQSEPVEFTEESYQRVLMKVYARGVAMHPPTPAPDYLQYPLPMQG